jgi:hypothetical protein
MAAIRAYTAKALELPPGNLQGYVEEERSDTRGEHTRGAAWQFEMWDKGEPHNGVRGWVTADGTVITADQNLGILLAESGIWASPAKAPQDDLAETVARDIVWSYGPGVTLETMRAWGLGPPELKLTPGGSGTLHFFANDHGGAKPWGGGGAPPDTYVENSVVLTADHKATLTRAPFVAKEAR